MRFYKLFVVLSAITIYSVNGQVEVQHNYIQVGDPPAVGITELSGVGYISHPGLGLLTIAPFGGDLQIGRLTEGILYDSDAKLFTVQSQLRIDGSVDVTPANLGSMYIGALNGRNIAFDANEIMARNNGSTSTLYLNNEGGEVKTGDKLSVGGVLEALGPTVLRGAIFAPNMQFIGDRKNMQFDSGTGLIGYDNSSRRYKQNIKTLEDDWTKILALRPVQYVRPSSPDYLEYGYIAEEVDEIGLTTMVGYDQEGIPDDVRYDKMIIYLVEMIKEQQRDITSLKKQVATLKKEK